MRMGGSCESLDRGSAHSCYRLCLQLSLMLAEEPLTSSLCDESLPDTLWVPEGTVSTVAICRTQLEDKAVGLEDPG